MPDADADRLAAQVLDISRRAQANRDERNLETLYIACRLANWKSEDGARPAEAPIVLLSVASRSGLTVRASCCAGQAWRRVIRCCCTC
ncbi:MAG: DUF4011 domain-containing protein [Microbacteriaceae bacterium]|nr:DUF4011 domain-containing protein [Microbacteriaceae bacterium]